MKMNLSSLVIHPVDPQGKEAMALLHEAAIEIRTLYPEVFNSESPMPINTSTPAHSIYLVGYLESQPVLSGALRPIDKEAVEIRRIFVVQGARRLGLARAMLRSLEARAHEFGYKVMRLETGNRQNPAMAFYERYGFHRIEPFGEYREDPTSVCYEKEIEEVRGD